MNYENIKKIIVNSFSEKKNSHSFMLSTNNVDRCLSEIIDVTKTINCHGNGNDDCNICRTIDSMSNPDVKIIKPDGKEIKKDQIMEVIDHFSKTPAINPFSVYIIVEADKLNISSANKLLKFLEEPQGNIIGFFITDNMPGIIPTIKSRCQLYQMKFGSESLLDLLNINDEDFTKYFNYVEHLIGLLNSREKYKIFSESKNLSSKERIDIQKVFTLISKVYELKYKSLFHSDEEYIDSVKSVIDLIDAEDINILINRIKILEEFLEGFKINVNKDLFINKFIIEWE